ncbi:hypothetical protein ONZ45_g8707 [Pleurotus djamor]|nr:hypothetical protein ONZ45_g8707 [Pleurotus djamor]
MHFYSLSSDLKPDWSSTHGSQPCIQEYWISLTKKYGLYSNIIFNTRIESAAWNSAKKYYDIFARNILTGERIHTVAEIFVPAVGLLNNPHYPKIDGLSSFQGQVFHSARWRADVDLNNKRVAVIGNAASAMQLVPPVAARPGIHVTQFCRTPSWILPPIRSDFSSTWKWSFSRAPFLMKLYRIKLFFDAELRYLVFINRVARWIVTKVTQWYMLALTPRRYHDKILPHYRMGCKRVLFDNGYLAALNRPNVELVWDEISRLSSSAIITIQGQVVPVDVVVLATGFDPQGFPIDVKGADGQTLREYYDAHGAPRAYMGSCIPGFPNLFLLGGPNTFAGHTSILYGTELSIDYCIALMRRILEHSAATVEVTAAATDGYNKRIQSMVSRSIFSHCSSWYRKGGNGVNAVIFPGGQIRRWWWFRKPVWAHFVVKSMDDRIYPPPPNAPSWHHQTSFTLLITGLIFSGIVLRALAH